MREGEKLEIRSCVIWDEILIGRLSKETELDVG